jgi:HEPN domain-containing protein
MYTNLMSQSDGKRWIEAAKSDLAAAQSLFEDGYYHLCAFHAQQSTEKSLKGLLRLLGHLPWGHNCFDLLTQVNELLPNAPVTPALFNAAGRLDGHYIPSRYPDAFPTGIPADYYNQAEAEQALEDAQNLIAFITGHLS